MPKLEKVIAIGPPKEAALYFDRVLPVDLARSLLLQRRSVEEKSNYIPFEQGVFDKNVIDSLLGDEHSEEKYRCITNLGVILHSSLLLHAKPEDIDNLDKLLSGSTEGIRLLFKEQGYDIDRIMREIKGGSFSPQDFAGRVADDYVNLISQYGYDGCALWNFGSAAHQFKQNPSDQERYVASLTGLKLADPAKVPWEQLIEFRRDPKSQAALRDLRVFFHKEYAGKDLQLISDELAATIERYEATAKLWGLDTAQRSLSVVFSQGGMVST